MAELTVLGERGRRYTSRSAYETSNQCMRQRFYAYEYEPVEMEGDPGARGIASTGLSIYLLVGSCVHLGKERLLKGDSVETAVARAKGLFWEELERGKLVVAPLTPEEQWPSQLVEWTMRSEEAMVEALVRVWDVMARPRLMETYEVLAVEEELRPVEIAPGIWFQAKADALLRSKATGALVMQSTKCLQSWGRKQEEQYRLDVQGITECWMMERQLEWWRGQLAAGNDNAVPGWFNTAEANMGLPLEVDLVQMEILLKGLRREDSKVKGQYIYHSPLTKAYRLRNYDQEGMVPLENQWAHAWDVPKVNGKTGEGYMGTLGSTWQRVFVWEAFPGGVAEWIRHLVAGDIQPDVVNPLPDSVVYPEPWGRNLMEMQSQMLQIQAKERRISEMADAVNAALRDPERGFLDKLAYLDVHFEMNRKNCLQWGGKCPFVRVCHGALQARVKPEVVEGFGRRRPHHEEVGEE